LFNRFKEKLSGFKEALSSKIQEKVSSAQGPKKDLTPAEEELSSAQIDSEAVTASRDQKAAQAQAAVPEAPKSEAETVKPKNRFSFLEKAKSLVFEQEVILEEKDLEEPMWALEMALLESDVALPVAEEIVREVKVDLVGAKKKIGANTGNWRRTRFGMPS